MRQPAGETRAGTSFSSVPVGIRQALRGPLETSLLYLDRRRRPPLDYGMPDGIRRVYLYHIRKTGGTSLSRSFLSLGGEDPASVERRINASFLRTTASGTYVFAGKLRRSLETGRYFFGWSHLPAYDLRLPPNTFTVSVLRDPVKRVISYYNYLIGGDDASLVFAIKQAERGFAAGGFHAFLDRVPKRHLLCQLYMFSSDFSVDEAAERLNSCSLILATERLKEGTAELNGRLGMRLEPRHERVSLVEAQLSTSELDRVRDLLEPEYQLFKQIGLAV